MTADKNMKSLLWKIRYTIRIRRRACLPWRVAWEFSSSALENVNGDTSECPIQAVEDEFDCWGQAHDEQGYDN